MVLLDESVPIVKRVDVDEVKVMKALPSDAAMESNASGVEVPMPSRDSTIKLPVPLGTPVGQAPPVHTQRLSSFKNASLPCGLSMKSPTESVWRSV